LGRDQRALQAEQPFNATGEKIRDGGLWCVYEFTWQMDAILFWDRFEGTLAARNRIPLPRAAERFAVDDTAKELAEVRPAKREVNRVQSGS